MIFLKQHFNLEPASFETRDRFVEAASEAFVPAAQEQGGRLLGAWFCHEEWFSQMVHVTGFESLAAYQDYRDALTADGGLGKAAAELASLAPEQRTELLETLGPIPEDAIDAAIARSAEKPAGVYTFAILEVVAGRMDQFKALLAAGAGQVPILASWRDLAGNSDRVIDLWRGDIGKGGYEPTSAPMDAFFGPLREVAPRERMARLHSLPYSPLR